MLCKKKFEYENKSTYKEEFVFLSTFKQEHLELFLYALGFFTIPLLPLNQLLTGTIINALLIKSAMDYETKKVYLFSIIPSTAVFLGGVLFGTLTPQILYMLLFIWAGNAVLMFLIRNLETPKINFSKKVFIAGATKSGLLFVCAFILYTQALVPELFLYMFGIIQFVTVSAGAGFVFAQKKLLPKSK